MAFYRACPFCGCNLDPGEICDCCERAQYIRKEVTQQHARDQTRRAGATIPVMRATGRRSMARR